MLSVPQQTPATSATDFRQMSMTKAQHPTAESHYEGNESNAVIQTSPSEHLATRKETPSIDEELQNLE